MLRARALLLLFTSLSAVPALGADSPKSLWIAKFDCETKAALVVANVQADVANAFLYANLFGSVSSFPTVSAAPSGAWVLTGKELEYSGGSAAERALVGFGTGRAYIVMQYELNDPTGKVVWSEKISSRPSFWGSAGAIGAGQNQSSAESKQTQKLVQDMAAFFHPPTQAKK